MTEKMTRQEAIPYLESVKRMKTVLPKTKEAIDVAVKSLKAEQISIESQEESAKKDDMLRVLFNRCMAISGLCMWCGLTEECNKYRSVLKSED